MFSEKLNKGFSLLETLVSTTITVGILLGTYQFTVSSKRIYVSQEEIIAADQQARVAMDQLIQSVRRAGSDPMETAFDLNVDDSVPIPVAQPAAVRILADLPQDTMNDAGDTVPDGDSFDIHDDGDGIWEDDENENGDGMLLPENADEQEDVTFLLIPSDENFVPIGNGPWTLVKRVPTGEEETTDIPLADNVITEAGQPGLEFRYIQKVQSGNPNVDILPASFSDRWDGTEEAGVAVNSDQYDTQQEKRLINRVLIRLTIRSIHPDRTTGDYKYIVLETDVDLRTQSL